MSYAMTNQLQRIHNDCVEAFKNFRILAEKKPNLLDNEPELREIRDLLEDLVIESFTISNALQYKIDDMLVEHSLEYHG